MTGAPFQRVLIANRGEIALRIVRACHDLGMEAIAVYSDADASALHVRAADRAVRIGPAPAAESYLRSDAIVAAALATGADAVHPGYGFLAERATFAEAVIRAGIVFVGPGPGTIARLGDKLAARRVAIEVGVPVVPGTLGGLSIAGGADLAAAMEGAEEVGFPLLVKAAAGGGGRGMRRVERIEELEAALRSGSSEAAAAFGDGTVYLEREIRPARHIEVQLLGDRNGTVVAIGERDCSIQRRHQKLVEESPAPGLSASERRELHAAAVRLGAAAGLTNAATAEFLFAVDRRCYFLEVNTRLQVEHGVTELVSGLDIVAEQFRLAAGEPLSEQARAAASRAAEPSGHAIEFRISAEDPAHDFAPAPGRIGRWAMPSGPGVRVDSGVEAGEIVPADYDPLIAKLLVHGYDRAAALARSRRALDEFEVGGVQTTIPFHRALVRHPGFAAGDLSTDWVASEWDGAADRARSGRIALIAAAFGAAHDGEAKKRPAVEDGSTSGSGRDGWRAGGRRDMSDRWPR